jgi:galactokinase
MAEEELFVPGRLCLFGEHSDWAGGYRGYGLDVEPGLCLIAGTEQGLRARASRLGMHFELRSSGTDGVKPRRYLARPNDLRDVARSGSYDAYAAGVAFYIIQRHGVGGLRLDVFERSLPVAKGLASSAAICVLTARAYSLVYGLRLSIEEEMELAYQGELLTGSACGRMDQACAYGRRPVLLSFDGEDVDVETLSPAADLNLLLVDLRASKNTRRILADLNAAFASDTGSVGEGVRQALGRENQRIAKAAREALESGDLPVLGRLMQEAQEVFDRLVAPACPSELQAPKLHAVLSHPLVADTTWGGKGVGSQGDGSAQLLCRSIEARLDLAAALEHDLDVTCLSMSIPAMCDLRSRQSQPPLTSAAG